MTMSFLFPETPAAAFDEFVVSTAPADRGRPTWTPPVTTISGLTGQGLDELWAKVLEHRKRLEATGELAAKRHAQDAKWMWALVHERLHDRLTHDPALRRRVPEIERAIAEGSLSPNAGASEIVTLLGL